MYFDERNKLEEEEETPRTSLEEPEKALPRKGDISDQMTAAKEEKIVTSLVGRRRSNKSRKDRRLGLSKTAIHLSTISM